MAKILELARLEYYAKKIPAIEKGDNGYWKLRDSFETRAWICDCVDFGCEFDEKGCRGHRHEEQGKCCCSGCATSGGYLRVVLAENIEKYQKAWDRNLGFWRKGKGCILPRNMRSSICSFFFCSAAKPVFQPHILHNIKRLSSIVDDAVLALDNIREEQ